MDHLKNAVKATRQAIVHRQHGTTSSDSQGTPHHQPPVHHGENSTSANVQSGAGEPPSATDVNDFSSPGRSLVDVHKPLPATPHIQGSSDDSHPTSSLPIPNRHSSMLKPSRLSRSRAQRPDIGARQPSIGIRRAPSSPSLRQSGPQAAGTSGHHGGDRRSAAGSSHMPTLVEESPTTPININQQVDQQIAHDATQLPDERPSLWARARRAVKPSLHRHDGTDLNGDLVGEDLPPSEYDSNMVDFLDTVDPEVATLTSLTNVQNSLFVPDLGRYVNRRPIYSLTTRLNDMTNAIQARKSKTSEDQLDEEEKEGFPAMRRTYSDAQSINTINSRLSDSRYAVLPHGVSLAGWSREEKDELNDHVRHMLHSRKSRFKRSMKGFGQYVRRPLGFLVTLYASLITLFGLAWVLFLIGWINVGGRQLYIINVIDNVLVGLFAVVGDGLAPFRAVDTYHMIFIAHYHHLTWRLRDKHELPKLQDHNDLPSKQPDLDADVESQEEFSILTLKQQERLTHHEKKFAKSHTFFKPHETETHYAFPLRLLVAVVVLLDFHSIFQIALGACTWSINYHHRPFALTTVILCCSISCNATAGILIMVGDRRTRKKDVLERMNRQELTEVAMGKIEKRREEEGEKAKDNGNEKVTPPPKPIIKTQQRVKAPQDNARTNQSVRPGRRSY